MLWLGRHDVTTVAEPLFNDLLQFRLQRIEVKPTPVVHQRDFPCEDVVDSENLLRQVHVCVDAFVNSLRTSEPTAVEIPFREVRA